MTLKTRPVLARQELALMKVVWRLGPATVRDVYEALREERRVAYTTVMTVMNILESKGYLRKEPEGRAFRYHATQPERRVMTALVRDFVDRVFDGAATPLLAHLVTDTKLSKPERDALRRLIDEANDGRKS
jgi:BlaI family transcriptional regulator, penicillinase repressor